MPAKSPPRNTRGAVRFAWGVSALAAVAAWAVGCGEPQPPFAVASIPDLTVEVGSSGSVDLAGHFSDADGDILTYTTTSSDPGVATTAVSGTTVQVTAVAAGNATVTVTALDPGGLSADQTFSVTVPNRAPVAVGSIDDAETHVGESFEVSLSGHFDDPDGDALAYAATSTDSSIASVSVSGATLRVAGVSQGAAIVTVTASDPGGLSATQTFSVTVPNRGPEAVGSIDDAETHVGESFETALAGYFGDPDGDALTYAATSTDSSIASVSVSGATLRVAGVGQGDATVTVTASDPGGLSATQTFSVTVPNRSPEAVGQIDDAETFVGESFETALAGYFGDPDGDALAYAATSTDPSTAGVFVSGATLRVAGVGQGDATVTVTASDPGGLSATQTFSVTVPNRAPEAVGQIDDAQTFVGESFETALAGHFSDPDGDALTYAATSSDSSIAGVSVSGGTLRVAGVSQGDATVTVTASDPGGLSATQTFSVTVPNRAPEAVGQIDDAETHVGESFEIKLAGHFSDPDGDDLAYGATSSSPANASVFVSGSVLTVTGVAKGDATVTVTASDPGGLSATQAFAVTVPNRAPEAVGQIDDADIHVGESIEVSLSGRFSDPDGDELTYAATSSDSSVATVSVSGATLRVAGVGDGTATVTATASDAGGLSAEQVFTVTVPNRAPEAVGQIADAETHVGESIEVSLSGHFSDPDGDALAYAATSSNSSIAGVSVSGATLRVAGVGNGTATITATASDAGGLSASQTFAVAVPNRAPEAVGQIDDAETHVGESIEVSLSGHFSDPDGDALAYAATSSNWSVATVSVSGGILRVAGVGQGAATVIVTATDAGGLSASQTFSVTVPNRAPEAVGQIDDAETHVGESIEVSLSGHFSDPDGDALAYAATSSNSSIAGVSVSDATLRVAGVGQGEATVTVTATDAGGLSASQAFSVTVPNRAPEAVGQIDDAETHVGESIEVSLSGHFSDPDGDALTYEVTSTDSSIASVSVSGGTLRVAGVGQGEATVTVTASDAGGLSASQTFTATVPNRAPEAVGQIADVEPAVGDTVEVALSGHFSDPDGDDLSYSASSSDDNAATVSVSGATIRVARVGKGAATVTATATDAGGLSASQTFAVTVPNRAPVAVGQIADVEPALGDTVEIALSGHFSDPDGDDLSYSASSSDDHVATVSVSGATLRVAGVGKGTATVTATATDPDGLSATQTFTAAVEGNRPPVAVGSVSDAGLAVGDRVEIELSGYFSDPDGDDLSYSASSSDGDVATVSVSGATLRVAGAGKGTATVTATATDPDGLSATQTFTAAVEGNRPPVAVGSISDVEPAVDDTVEIALSGYFSDPDGDALSYSASSSDGDVATVSVSGATLRVAGAGNGTATVTATAKDPDGLSASHAFAVTVPNRAPEAVGPIADAEIFVDDTVEIALSGYFSDPDGDALSYSASSSDGDVATVSVSGATLRVAGVGKGTATVTATATDPGDLSATQTFTAAVEGNRPPVAVGSISDAGLAVDDTVEIELSGYFSDPDGDDLSYSASSSDGEVATVSVSGATLRVAGGGKGTATVTATATDPDGLSATQTFTAAVEGNRPPVAVGSISDAEPAVDDTVETALSGYFSDPDGDDLSYSASSSDDNVATVSVSGATLRVVGAGKGTATVTATASDPDGLSASHAFAVTVPNRAPEAVGPIADAGLAVDDTVEIMLSQYFSDPDGDDLSYLASSSDDNVATVSVSGATLRVVAAAKGDATVTATASDPDGLSASQAFAVTVPNRAPEAVGSISDAEPAVDDTVKVALSGYFSDPDGDALSYAASSSDDEVATVSVSGATLRVAGAAKGTATVTATASDPDGLSASQAFKATVPNRAPEAVGSISDAEPAVDDTVKIALSGYFSDPDGDALSYAASSSDDEVATVSVSGATLRVAGVGKGTATVTATAWTRTAFRRARPSRRRCRIGLPGRSERSRTGSSS